MADLTEQLSSLLSDPEGMQRLKTMAEGLLGNSEKVAEPQPENEPLINPAALSQMAKIMSKRTEDSREQLLKALRPHLSPEKQKRVDSAIKMLRLLDLAPMLSGLGLFEL